MGFFDKFIPKEITKPIAKIGRKIIPREIRPALPFLAAATPFLLPGGFAIGGLNPALSRGIMSSLANVGSQKVLDPEGELNDLSILLAGLTGAGATEGAGQALRDQTTFGKAIGASDMIGPVDPSTIAERGFFKKAADLGLTGTAKAADFLGGSRETLGALGSGEMDLFSKAGIKAAGRAAALPASQGTGDLAYATATAAIREFNAAEAAELAQAGLDEAAIANARRAAIREAMEVSGFTEEDILETFDEIGLKEGGIVSLAEGGMLNFGGREMDLRGGGFVPIGKKEKADDVPARLSKNEFVMTADAVRAAGGGSVNKGAQRMYNLMNNLEARA